MSRFYARDIIPGAVTGQGSDAFGARWSVLTPAGTEVTSSVPLRAMEMSRWDSRRDQC